MALVPAIQNAATNLVPDGYGMNYLQLVQRLAQECGVSSSGPASLAGLTGELRRLANWVRHAWLDIQRHHPDWQFLQQPIEFVTSADKDTYSMIEMLVPNLSNYKLDSFRIYTLGAPGDEMYLPYMPYDAFRDYYLFGSSRTTRNRPDTFTIDPQKNLVLGPCPDRQFVVNGHGYVRPGEFTDELDVPALPSEFHMIIVYRAMMLYGQYESAPEVFAAGYAEFGKMLTRLSFDQLPKMGFGGPLV